MTSVSFGGENSALQVGVSNGSIYYNVPAKQPESRPKPLMTVPFPHDPDFVGRDELDQLLERSSIPGSRTVLVGLGGVGKSRLAIEYCYQVRQRSPETWVFWVHASTAARYEESVRNLADRANIPGRQDHNANIFQLFANWLQDGDIKKWVLVIDNVDDDELLRKPLGTWGEAREAQHHIPTRPPLKYLLETSTGSIVITSRNKSVALEIAGHERYVIHVQPMDLESSLLLMQKKLDSDTESDGLRQLVEELEFMPLAMVQAASYISHHSPRCSVLRYLDMLRCSESQAMKLLRRESHVTHRDWEAKNSILLTWQISFDYIREIRQSAADLLSLMSFFDRQGIPESILKAQDKNSDHREGRKIVFSTRRNLRHYVRRFGQTAADLLSSKGAFGEKMNPRSLVQDFADISAAKGLVSSMESDMNDDFQTDITILMDYSLIAIGENAMVFTMHRLVQQIVRTWLEGYGEQEKWKECFISNLNNEFPTSEYENWEKCRSLFPHVRSAKSYRPESRDSLKAWATLLYKGSCYANVSGNLSEFTDMAAMSRDERMKIGGTDDQDTLDSTLRLGEAYLAKGLFGGGREAFSKGSADPYKEARDQGRHHEAEKLKIQVLEGRQTRLGMDHLDTIESINNLAVTYTHQGQYLEAEKLGVQAIEAYKKNLGLDHPDTLKSMSDLAATYYEQGRHIEAENLQLQVLEGRQTRLGVDHPDTLGIIANLAVTYIYQGRYDEAERLGVQAIEAYKKSLGMDHPNTLTSMGNLAVTYAYQGRYHEAEKLGVQAMEACKLRLGRDHPDTLSIMVILAYTWYHMGRSAEAIDLLRDCLNRQERAQGSTHPHTLATSRVLLEWEARSRLSDAAV
ncbi:uncharacterized protein N7506_003416 [Penicillium brevicompactum]|uniref:uncharacterized protein n=1 Tax=Penicillium brevicompactum TaxID=5074 RepID=UPI002540A37A|nr:uncharacterized protein N7506_003416 [Penicillium brevicompactum]KAJ5343592.1 hypothetical protein N7506_003416 [Penicillium brevicompactum]